MPLSLFSKTISYEIRFFGRFIALERIFLYTYLVPGDNITLYSYNNRNEQR